MNTFNNLSRRNFLFASAAVGGGLALGFALPVGKVDAATVNSAKRINIWVEVAPDNTVTIKYARSEMGQGSLTSAPQLVADELDANWDQVRIAYVDVHEHLLMNKAWGSMQTVGSQTIRNSQDYLRKAGATARAMLVAAAAQSWKVPASEITVQNGIVAHAASKKQSGFGALAALAATMPVPKDVTVKDPKNWHIIGQSMPRIDIPASVNGAQVYGVDVSLPGMVYAAIAQCPVFGGKARSFDAASARERRGVIDVFTIDGDTSVVVVADNWWRAKQALAEVQIEWDDNGNGKVDDASIRKFFRDGLAAKDADPLRNNKGDVDGALKGATKVLEAEYFTPYLSHSPMEPMGATVQIGADQVQVWASTQAADGLAGEVAGALQRKPEEIYVHRVQAGGGFGRRGGGDYARQAALIAAKLPQGTPVKLLWTREEDTQHGMYRPLAMYKLQAGLDANNTIVGWRTRIASGSLMSQRIGAPLGKNGDAMATEGFSRLPYNVANQDHSYIERRTHIPIGFWRTVGWSQTPFAREQFIDELAQAAGEDPLQFRLRHMAQDELSRHILEVAANAADWKTPPAKGVFRGIATTEPYDSFTAAVVELSVNDAGVIRIHRIVQAINSGHVVNPNNVEAQLQGATVWALTAAMWGEIGIEQGRVKQSNFHDYRVLRLSEMPKVEVVLAPTGGFWGGVGEPGQAPLLPAFCNALAAATGKRYRTLPLRQYGLTLA
ncbi:MAG TPA: molybdopterin cofactor-binding domain-containing protein [Candidatus Acidoferrum sp.]|nr:molybdopterin cofactor-binding domain-containing protein [Candidatus Acidoferrum sp.]